MLGIPFSMAKYARTGVGTVPQRSAVYPLSYIARKTAVMILEVLDGLVANGPDSNAEIESGVKAKVIELCGRFPVYPSGA